LPRKDSSGVIAAAEADVAALVTAKLRNRDNGMVKPDLFHSIQADHTSGE